MTRKHTHCRNLQIATSVMQINIELPTAILGNKILYQKNNNGERINDLSNHPRTMLLV